MEDSEDSYESLSDTEFTEWNGFSTDENDNYEDIKVYASSRTEEKDLDNFRFPAHQDGKISDMEASVLLKAKNFKDWAREQSGFGPSASNISTLPPRQFLSIDLNRRLSEYSEPNSEPSISQHSSVPVPPL